MLKIDIQTDEIPDLFIRFRDVIHEHYWLKRISAIKQTARNYPFLKHFLIEENAIAIALARCSYLVAKYGRIPMQETKNHDLYPAISLAAQVLSIMKNCSSADAKRLVQRIRGAFQRPDNMRAIQLEIVAATHFVQRGYKIVWPEMEGIGNFDILVKDIGTNGLEVECKSVSADKGRKIHRREALEFHHYMEPKLQTLSRNLKKGVAVVLTVPGRLPTSYQQQDLVKRVIGSVISTKSIVLNDGSDVRVSEFDMTTLGDIGTVERPTISRAAIDKITATENRECMFLGSNTGAIIFVLQSRQDDTQLKYVFDTLSESAKNQVSKSRAALFLVDFHGIESEGLLNIAKQDKDPKLPPTALHVAVSKFLGNQDREHVIGVGFLSASALEPELHGVVKSSGTAYVFQKKESRFWHQDFSRLFS